MNLYFLYRDQDPGEVSFGQWVSSVVVAESEEDARLIHPETIYCPVWNGKEWGYFSRIDEWCDLDDWINPELVVVKFLGEAIQTLSRGVITSFNTGA